MTWLARIERVLEEMEVDSTEAAHLRERVLRHRDGLLSNGGKKCVACKRTKPVRAFDLHVYGEDGLKRECRDCQKTL